MFLKYLTRIVSSVLDKLNFSDFLSLVAFLLASHAHAPLLQVNTVHVRDYSSNYLASDMFVSMLGSQVSKSPFYYY